MHTKGRIADCDETPPAPNPGGGPAPHYRQGGRTRALTYCEGGKAGRRMDRPGRKRGGKTPNFNPGGEKGKLHRELGIAEDEKIPVDRLASAARSDNPEIRRDAIRAQTMKKWKH